MCIGRKLKTNKNVSSFSGSIRIDYGVEKQGVPNEQRDSCVPIYIWHVAFHGSPGG